MKRSAIFFSLIVTCLITTSAFGQKGCEPQVVGTWKSASADGTESVFYRFGPDAKVTVLSGAGAQLREVASAVYALDDPKAPKSILFKAAKSGGGLVEGTTATEIAAYDDTSLTLVRHGSAPTRLIKVDPYKYFIVLAGRSGTFYDSGGPAFPMMIKTDGRQTQVDAIGIYSLGGNRAFGPIPAETYNEFMKEPRSESDVMLRLEITGAQYERSLKIVRTWERRAREGDLLYTDPYLNNVLFVRQVAESLNQCGERIKMYKLNWMLDDHISDKSRPPVIPFKYFKELRRLNESLHVRDAEFQELGQQAQKQAGQ